MCTRKNRLIISFFTLSFLLIAVFAQMQKASVVSASSDLQVTTQNGATFVTTQSVDPSPSDPATTTTAASNGQTVSAVVPPTGFATNIGQVINFILQAIIVVAVLLVFGNLVYGGVLWITSGGDKSKTETARNRIVASVVGLVVVAASYAIFVLILHFLGFSDINDLFNKAGTINNPGISVESTATDSSKLRQENLVQ